MATITNRILNIFSVETDKAVKETEALKKSMKGIEDQSNKTTKTIETNAQKRAKLLKEEQEDLKELRKRSSEAFKVRDIEQFNKRIKETEGRIKTLKGETRGFSKDIKRLGAAIGIAFGVQQLISFGKELVEILGQSQAIRASFETTFTDKDINKLREATRGTVSDLELMKQAVRARNFKIPLDTLAKGLEFAQKRARATGKEVDFLVESFVDGIGRKSALKLDDLGISLVEIQKEVKKTGDFTEAAGNIIDRELAEMGDIALTSGDKVDQLGARFDNLKETAANALSPIINNLLSIGEAFIPVASGPFRTMDEQIQDATDSLALLTNDLSDDMKKAVDDIVFSSDAIGESYLFRGVTGARGEIDNSILSYKAALREIERIGEAVKFIQDTAKLEILIDNIKSLTQEEQRLFEILAKNVNQLNIEDTTLITNTLELIKLLGREGETINELQSLIGTLNKVRNDAIGGSDTFIETTKRLTKAQDDLAKLLGKETEAEKKARLEREKAAKEEEKRLLKLEALRNQVFDAQNRRIEDEETQAIVAENTRFERQEEALRKEFKDSELLHEALELNEQAHEENLAKIRKDASDKRVEELLKVNQKLEDIRLGSITDQLEGIQTLTSSSSDLAQIRIQAINAEVEAGEELSSAQQKQIENIVAIQKGLFVFEQLAAIATILVNLQIEISNIARTTAALGPAGIPIAAAQITAAKIRAGIGVATVAAQAIPQFASFAKGTKDAPGGLSLVGEEGPEFVQLQKGAKVLPNKQTRENSGLIDAMMDNNLDKYIFNNHVKGNEAPIFDDYRLFRTIKDNKTVKLDEGSISNLSNAVLRGSMESDFKRLRSWSTNS